MRALRWYLYMEKLPGLVYCILRAYAVRFAKIACYLLTGLRIIILYAFEHLSGILIAGKGGGLLDHSYYLLN